MSDLKKIKDEFISKLKEKLNLAEINKIKSDLFGKNGLFLLNLKKLEQLLSQKENNLPLILISSKMNCKI